MQQADRDAAPSSVDEIRGGGTSTLAVVARVLAGLIGGFLGFYAGLFVMLSLFGLELPDASAAAMVGGAGLVGSAAAALAARLSAAQIGGFAASGLIIGLLAGVLNEATVDSFEIGVVSAALIVIAAAALTTRFDQT